MKSRESFKQMIAESRAQQERAENLVTGALSMNRPRLALVKGDRALLLCRSTYGQAYRVTDLDQHGPSGHRDYAASDIHGMAQEVASALYGGFEIRS